MCRLDCSHSIGCSVERDHPRSPRHEAIDQCSTQPGSGARDERDVVLEPPHNGTSHRSGRLVPAWVLARSDTPVTGRDAQPACKRHRRIFIKRGSGTLRLLEHPRNGGVLDDLQSGCNLGCLGLPSDDGALAPAGATRQPGSGSGGGHHPSQAPQTVGLVANEVTLLGDPELGSEP